MDEWFSSGYLDKVTGKGVDGGENGLDFLILFFLPGIGRITVVAAEIAASQANEDTGQPGIGGFTLYRVKDLGNLKVGHWVRKRSVRSSLFPTLRRCTGCSDHAVIRASAGQRGKLQCVRMKD